MLREQAYQRSAQGGWLVRPSWDILEEVLRFTDRMVEEARGEVVGEA